MNLVTASPKKFFDKKIRHIASCQKILDVGGGSRFQKQLKPYEDLFKGKNYVCIDADPSYNPDVVGDVHSLPFDDASFDAILCHSVLEHTKQPFQVMDEIYRVLRPRGLALLYVPFLYPYHGGGSYLDYWRFSRDGIEILCQKFSSLEICAARNFFEAWFYLLPQQINPPLVWFGRKMDELLKTHKQRTQQTSGWYFFVQK